MSTTGCGHGTRAALAVQLLHWPVCQGSFPGTVWAHSLSGVASAFMLVAAVEVGLSRAPLVLSVSTVSPYEESMPWVLGKNPARHVGDAA